jgi:putative aldouronate transport system permease protein
MEKSAKPGYKSLLPNIAIHSVFLIYCLLVILPIIMVVIISFTDEGFLNIAGYRFIPGKMNLNAYIYIFTGNVTVLNAYAVTMLVTAAGTILNLIISSLLSYPLSRAEVKYRSRISFFVMFPLLFSGGMVPWYILISKYLHLSDNLLALIVPYAVSSVYVLIMRNFFRDLPDAIVEAARIDGSGEFNTFIAVILPLSKPIIATVGLFVGIFFWNDWYTCSLFISENKLFTLQYLLQIIMNQIAFLQGNDMLRGTLDNLPSESARMAACVLTVAPILFLYPFLQRYIVKGLTLGAVKT